MIPSFSSFTFTFLVSSKRAKWRTRWFLIMPTYQKIPSGCSHRILKLYCEIFKKFFHTCETQTQTPWRVWKMLSEHCSDQDCTRPNDSAFSGASPDLLTVRLHFWVQARNRSGEHRRLHTLVLLFLFYLHLLYTFVLGICICVTNTETDIVQIHTLVLVFLLYFYLYLFYIDNGIDVVQMHPLVFVFLLYPIVYNVHIYVRYYPSKDTNICDPWRTQIFLQAIFGGVSPERWNMSWKYHYH